MGMSIGSNLSSMNAQRNLYRTGLALDTSLSRLSSGLRISKSGDDAAGLGISSALEAQIRSYNQGARNASDAVSLVQTAEGGLNETSNILARLRELAMQSASEAVGDSERSYIQTEVTALGEEIDRLAAATEFNGTSLLQSSTTSLSFQVGIRNTSNDRLSITTVDMRMSGLFTGAASLTSSFSLDMSTSTAAGVALADIDAAIGRVSAARASFGSLGNRLQIVISNNQTAAEALSAANSRIKDVDVAEETSRLARSQIMIQAGISVLAQANMVPQLAIKLLG